MSCLTFFNNLCNYFNNVFFSKVHFLYRNTSFLLNFKVKIEPLLLIGDGCAHEKCLSAFPSRHKPPPNCVQYKHMIKLSCWVTVPEHGEGISYTRDLQYVPTASRKTIIEDAS